MDFNRFAALLTACPREPESARIAALASVLGQLAPRERAAAVYLLQARLGSPNQRRRDIHEALPTRELTEGLRAERRTSPRAPAPDVEIIYGLAHAAFMAGPDREFPLDYMERLRPVLGGLDEPAIEWFAAALHGTAEPDDVLLAALAAEVRTRQSAAHGPAGKHIEALYRRTLPDLGHIARLLAERPFLDVIVLGPQHGLLVPREEIRRWHSTADAWAEFAAKHVVEAYAQCKLDGEHVQLHKRGDEVIALAISGRDVSARLPDVCAAAAAAIPVPDAILDAEVLAINPATRELLKFNHAFEPLPHQVVVFDVLQWNGKDRRGLKYEDRKRLIEMWLPPFEAGAAGLCRVLETAVRNAAETQAAYDRFLTSNYCEGIVLKDKYGPCLTGQTSFHRGKIKPYASLDSVLVGVRGNCYLVALWKDEKREVLVPYALAESIADDRPQIEAFCTHHCEIARPASLLAGARTDYWVTPELVVDVQCNGFKKRDRSFPGVGYTLRGSVTIRGISAGKSIDQANSLDLLLSLPDERGAAYEPAA